MKTEDRKQLTTNELGQFGLQIGKFFETHGRNVLIGVGATVAIAAAVIYWVRSSNAAEEAGWTRLAACASAKDYADLAEDRQFRGTAVAAWARLRESNIHLSNGIRGYFTDRKSGRSDMRAARDAFTQVLEADGVPAEVRERALYGQAVCLETMSDGEATDAIKAYKLLLTSYPDTIYKEEAERRAKALESADMQTFYAWYDKQNPKPSDRVKPNDGFPGGHPDFRDRIPGGLIPSLTEPPAPSLPEDPVENPFDPEEKTKPDDGKTTEGKSTDGKPDEKSAPKKNSTDKTPPKKNDAAPRKGDAKSDEGTDSKKNPAPKSS
jgi:hypothetical protein